MSKTCMVYFITFNSCDILMVNDNVSTTRLSNEIGFWLNVLPYFAQIKYHAACKINNLYASISSGISTNGYIFT